MNDRLDGFGERIKRLNPLWSLGKSMSLGPLNDYAPMLSLLLLLEVFYRELDSNQQRTRLDLIESAGQMIEGMKLGFEVLPEQVERIVEGLLWYKDPELQQPFMANYYDEKNAIMDTHSFRYLKEDRYASDWAKGGKTVYQLTEEALEIIFMSREWLQELEISIDQMYIQQQMKRGNFRKAQRGLDDLLARVRRLIQQELEYQEDIRRNPKMIFQQGMKLRSKREAEIKKQFDEEKQRFDELLHTLHRLSGSPTDDQRQLQEKIEQTRLVHDRFAQCVLQNMSLEIELRYKFPHLFWKQSNINFRQTIWEESIEKNGLPHPDAMCFVLQPLFSPQPDFIFPMDWIWQEQDMLGEMVLEQESVDDNEADEANHPERMVDWDEICQLWGPIMHEVIEYGSYSLSQLRDVSIEVQQAWTRQKEAIDLWLMFYGSSFTVPALDTEDKSLDERLQLLRSLYYKNGRMRELVGKQIIATIEPGKAMIRWKGVVITPFRIEIVNAYDTGLPKQTLRSELQ